MVQRVQAGLSCDNRGRDEGAERADISVSGRTNAKRKGTSELVPVSPPFLLAQPGPNSLLCVRPKTGSDGSVPPGDRLDDARPQSTQAFWPLSPALRALSAPALLPHLPSSQPQRPG